MRVDMLEEGCKMFILLYEEMSGRDDKIDIILKEFYWDSYKNIRGMIQDD